MPAGPEFVLRKPDWNGERDRVAAEVGRRWRESYHGSENSTCPTKIALRHREAGCDVLFVEQVAGVAEKCQLSTSYRIMASTSV
jgi:hypothetical protein